MENYQRKTYSVYENRIQLKYNYLYLEDQIIAYNRLEEAPQFDPIWLPAGKYNLSLRKKYDDEKDSKITNIRFISGVEYEVND